MKKNGFTLIEIMIILLVFSIGVLSVLKLILHNINTMGDLNAKTTSTLLAKEGLELVYNTRDSNRLASLPWDCIVNDQYNENMLDNVCKNYFLDNQGLRTIDIQENKTKRVNIGITNILQESKLFINHDIPTSYTHKITDEESIFSRYILFTGAKDSEKIINTGYFLKIESHVLYQRGSKTGEIILEGFIGNY